MRRWWLKGITPLFLGLPQPAAPLGAAGPVAAARAGRAPAPRMSAANFSMSNAAMSNRATSNRATPRKGLVALLCLPALLLAGCGGVKIAPQPVLPKALVQPIKARVGFVLPPDQKNYAHNETRAGVPWSVSLGEGQRKLAREVFKAAFLSAEEFDDLGAAQRADGLQAIFEARIEQYSFATARETGGEYVAVTIRYRILLRTPQGEPVDAFTLTGYGSAEAAGMGSSEPLDLATRKAMRDAAAKFLTQFPEQSVAKTLANGRPLVAAAATATAPLATLQAIETVPVRESRRGKAGTVNPTPPPATLPEATPRSGSATPPAVDPPAVPASSGAGAPAAPPPPVPAPPAG